MRLTTTGGRSSNEWSRKFKSTPLRQPSPGFTQLSETRRKFRVHAAFCTRKRAGEREKLAFPSVQLIWTPIKSRRNWPA